MLITNYLYAWAQNIAISIYGIWIQFVRFGGDYKNVASNVEQLGKTITTRDQLEKYRNGKLNEFVSYAYRHSPYYKRVFDDIKVSPENILTKEDLACLPILEKEPLRSGVIDIVSKDRSLGKLLKVKTTGTTGTPLSIYSDKAARRLNYAFYSRFLKNSGINLHAKRATFGGRIFVPSWQTKPPFWRLNYFQSNLLFSSYHLADKNIPFYIKKLKSFKPAYIDSYPSSLFTIAQYAKDHNISLSGITKAITTSAETLFSEQRAIIEEAFEVPIFDQYGAAEMCIFSAQCREGVYHLHEDYGVVEFIREDGSSALPGEDAEIVCTGFVNKAFPLIRYRIGDRGVYSDETCACGSPFPVLTELLGRIDDVILTPDGRRVGRLSPVVKGFPVKEVQYIQHCINELEVLVVKAEGYSSKVEKLLEQELRKRLGQDICLKFIYVDRINRGKGAKLKSIISHLK